MLKILTKENFDIETGTGLKLVEFFAPWCGYCKKQETELKAMEKVWIGQVNTDEEPDIAIKNGIHSFPTFIIYNSGKEVERFCGLRKKEDLMNIIMKHLST